MNDILRQFYVNEMQRETVKEFLLTTLNEVALDKLFKGEDASAVKLAKEVVETAFSNLKEKYEIIDKKDVINQSI